MDKHQQSLAISDALSVRWASLDDEQRAQAVIDWCHDIGVDTSSILARPLAAAMSRQPAWAQRPECYMDMINSIAAFLAAR